MAVVINEWLDIGGIVLNRDGAWLIEDLSPVLGASEQRGKDRVVPESAGAVARPRRKDVTTVNLDLMVFGRLDYQDNAHADVRNGLFENLAYLHNYVVDPTNTGNGTRTATLHWYSQTELTKPVHVLGDLDPEADGPNLMRCTLRLSFPEGLFDLASLAP